MTNLLLMCGSFGSCPPTGGRRLLRSAGTRKEQEIRSPIHSFTKSLFYLRRTSGRLPPNNGRTMGLQTAIVTHLPAKEKRKSKFLHLVKLHLQRSLPAEHVDQDPKPLAVQIHFFHRCHENGEGLLFHPDALTHGKINLGSGFFHPHLTEDGLHFFRHKGGR